MIGLFIGLAIVGAAVIMVAAFNILSMYTYDDED